jgi:acyl-CoA dehydrogenase
MRDAVNDAMDVHGGKTIIDGPLNYLGNVYRSIPVGITVEGANIVTRSLIIFGQGVTRAHPYLADEMLALGEENEEDARQKFDKLLAGHARHILANTGRAFLRGWSGGLLSPAGGPRQLRKYYRQVSRYSAALAFASEMALVSLGGDLKRKEMISARFGDVLSELYLVSAVLKRWQEDGRHREDLVLVEWCCRSAFQRIEAALKSIAANFPNRPLGWLLRAIALPYGTHTTGPSDKVVSAAAEAISAPGEQRDRIAAGVYEGRDGEPIALLERALRLTLKAEELEERLRKAGYEDKWGEAKEANVLSASEFALLNEAAEAVHRAVVVDEFEPERFGALLSSGKEDDPLPIPPLRAAGSS